ncbi:MAG: DNA recombination protein RmuC [Candidatus Pacebacteria bacterium]|nr:DNA recombination protein RmuC [Candidatus Paceibacterota bacterium]
MVEVIVFVTGLAIGGGLAYYIASKLLGQNDKAVILVEREREILNLKNDLRTKDENSQIVQNLLSDERVKNAGLIAKSQAETKANEEKQKLLLEAQESLTAQFALLSQRALSQNNDSFLKLAQSNLEKFQQAAQGDLDKRGLAISELVKPINETLAKVESTQREMERVREGAYQSVLSQATTMKEMAEGLRLETGNLTKALRSPTIRGRWGEIQLKRVVELAGMLEHCDFDTQVSTKGEGGVLRPDMVVHLPGQKTLVIDAKAPLEHYLSSIEAADEAQRGLHLKNHARVVADHVKKLGAKSYYDQFNNAPEFVVLFLPGEHFFAAALEMDGSLIEVGADLKVIIATPTTLIALLRTVAYGWRQDALTQNAAKIADLGKELFDRLSNFGDHFGRVGESLNRAVENYDKAVGTLESRVFVTARKFSELESTPIDGKIEPLTTLGRTTREVKLLEGKG